MREHTDTMLAASNKFGITANKFNHGLCHDFPIKYLHKLLLFKNLENLQLNNSRGSNMESVLVHV